MIDLQSNTLYALTMTKKDEKPTEIISVRLTPSLLKKAQKIAEREHRPLSNLIMSVLADYVDGKLKRNY